MSDQPPKIVYVEWLDSIGHPGWKDPDELTDPPPMRCITIGFLVRETDDVVTVSASWSATGSFDCPISIPWIAVIKYYTVGLKT